METANDIMKKIAPKRSRISYKTKMLNWRGWCVVLGVILAFMSGACIYAVYSVSELRSELSGRPPVIMPNGDMK